MLYFLFLSMVYKVKIGAHHFATLWDVGGQERLRAIWPHYFNGIDGIIFLVDSADASRIEEAKFELHNAYTSKELTMVRYHGNIRRGPTI